MGQESENINNRNEQTASATSVPSKSQSPTGKTISRLWYLIPIGFLLGAAIDLALGFGSISKALDRETLKYEIPGETQPFFGKEGCYEVGYASANAPGSTISNLDDLTVSVIRIRDGSVIEPVHAPILESRQVDGTNIIVFRRFYINSSGEKYRLSAKDAGGQNRKFNLYVSMAMTTRDSTELMISLSIATITLVVALLLFVIVAVLRRNRQPMDVQPNATNEQPPTLPSEVTSPIKARKIWRIIPATFISLGTATFIATTIAAIATFVESADNKNQTYQMPGQATLYFEKAGSYIAACQTITAQERNPVLNTADLSLTIQNGDNEKSLLTRRQGLAQISKTDNTNSELWEFYVNAPGKYLLSVEDKAEKKINFTMEVYRNERFTSLGYLFIAFSLSIGLIIAGIIIPTMINAFFLKLKKMRLIAVGR